MASYHCSIKKPISRAKGHSLMRKAAYNGRTQHFDGRTGKLTADFKNAGKLLDLYILIDPKAHAPSWMKNDVEKLLNASNRMNPRKDAQEAHEIVIGHIHELGRERNKWLINDLLHEEVTRKSGHIAVVYTHPAHRKGDDRNEHKHVLLLPYRAGPDGLTKERIPFLGTADIDRIREKFAILGAKELRKLARETGNESLLTEAERFRWGHLHSREYPDEPRSRNGNNQEAKAILRSDWEWAEHCRTKKRERHEGPVMHMEERGIRTHVGDQNARDKKPNRGRNRTVGKTIGTIQKGLKVKRAPGGRSAMGAAGQVVDLAADAIASIFTPTSPKEHKLTQKAEKDRQEAEAAWSRETWDGPSRDR